MIRNTLLNQIEADRAGGRSINEIAKAMNVPQPVLSRFISGKRSSLSLETLEKIASHYHFELRKDI